jgi:cytochrome c peroxidase
MEGKEQKGKSRKKEGRNEKGKVVNRTRANQTRTKAPSARNVQLTLRQPILVPGINAFA